MLSEVLEATADEIEKRGHCKGVLVNEAGAVCALGALSLALGGVVIGVADARYPWLEIRMPDGAWSTDSMASVVAVEDYLGTGNIVDWNNAPERKPQEVIDAFRGAAKQERMKEEGVF